jgi:hypothetical protein
MLNPPLVDMRRLALLGLTHPAEYILPVPDVATLVANGTHHALEGTGVAPGAEGDDVLAGTACVLARQARVRMKGRRSSDVGAGEEEDIAILALTEVQSARAFVVGSLMGCNEEAESGSEGLAELRDGVSDGVEGEHLGASNGAGDNGLAEAYLEAAEASLSQQVGDGLGCSVGKLVGERLRLDTDPNEKRAERPLPRLCESEGINRCPMNIQVVEQGVDALAQLTPGGLHRMTMNAASLSDDPLGLGASVYGPGVSILIDAQSAAGGAVEVVGGVGIEDGEAFTVRDDGLLVLVEFELSEIGGSGGGDEGDGRREGRPGAHSFGEIVAGVQEDLVDVENGVRRHWKTRGNQREEITKAKEAY